MHLNVLTDLTATVSYVLFSETNLYGNNFRTLPAICILIFIMCDYNVFVQALFGGDNHIRKQTMQQIILSQPEWIDSVRFPWEIVVNVEPECTSFFKLLITKLDILCIS